MLPTLCAAAGDPDVKQKLKRGMSVGSKTFKVHLDGYNVTGALAGKSPSPRKEFFYFKDDGSLVGLRYERWKIVFAEQRASSLEAGQDPTAAARLPRIFNLRSDPFETADHEEIDYERWRLEHLFVLVPAQDYVTKFLNTFKEFPPRQKPDSVSVENALKALQKSGSK
jgi:arylsulfatase A-like enzyme